MMAYHMPVSPGGIVEGNSVLVHVAAGGAGTMLQPLPNIWGGERYRPS